MSIVPRTLPVPVLDKINMKYAAPPLEPPPPPPVSVAESTDDQPDISFNLELSRNQHEQYGAQFTEEPRAPVVTIVGKEVLSTSINLVVILRLIGYYDLN